MTILNRVASTLDNLTATNPICVALGTTLTFGTNLFLYSEPSTDVTAVTIIPYGGEPPNKDNYRQMSAFQIQMKAESNQTLMNTQQKILEFLNMKQLSNQGQVRSRDSAPMIIGVTEGGQFKICVTNYYVTHLKQ